MNTNGPKGRRAELVHPGWRQLQAPQSGFFLQRPLTIKFTEAAFGHSVDRAGHLLKQLPVHWQRTFLPDLAFAAIAYHVLRCGMPATPSGDPRGVSLGSCDVTNIYSA